MSATRVPDHRRVPANAVQEPRAAHNLPDRGPEDGDRFCVTDDAVVEFCERQIEQEGQQLEELCLDHGSFSKDLFKRLIQVITQYYVRRSHISHIMTRCNKLITLT